jgi:uncharacterized protein YqeY
MELLAKLQEDMKAAMKSGQKDRLGVIRMLISDVKNVDLMPGKPTPEQAVEAYGKKLRKALEEYVKLNQPEPAEKLKFEISVVEEYLPKKASEEDTAKLVDAFLAQNSFTEKQTGQAIGGFMKAHGGTVEATIASKLIRAKLAGR